MGDSRGQGPHRGDLPGLHQLLLVHLQFVNHPVEGPEERKEFLRPGFRIRERGEIAMGNLVHGLLHLEQWPDQQSGHIKGHHDSQDQEDCHGTEKEIHGPLEQPVDLEAFFLFPALGDVEQFLALVAQGFLQ